MCFSIIAHSFMVTAMLVTRQPLEMGNGYGRKATEFLWFLFRVGIDGTERDNP